MIMAFNLLFHITHSEIMYFFPTHSTPWSSLSSSLLLFKLPPRSIDIEINQIENIDSDTVAKV